MSYRPAFAFLALAVLGSWGILASAQGPTIINRAPSQHVLVAATAVEEILPPISPKTSPGPMSLDACIDLGFQHQPALDAARASLSAAHTGKRSVDRLIIPRLFVKDLPVRRQQACEGLTIAEAGLTQAEWETRYAITRNFFTMQYIRAQEKVIDEVLFNLNTARDRAEDLFMAALKDIKINKLDLEFLDVQIALVKDKKAQVVNGKLKALAALREAMGLSYDYPLEIAAVDMPTAVYPVTGTYDARVYGPKGFTGKTEKKKRTEYRRLYQIDKVALINAAIANRGEMIQANAARRVTDLEVEAQSLIKGWQGRTFASGADIHVQPIPQGTRNGDYAPGAFSIEMPAMLAGRKRDREQRARDLAQRAAAVVDKAQNLVSLDVEAQYLKWQEAAEDIETLRAIEKIAIELPIKAQKLQPRDFTSSAVIQANITAITVRTQLNEQMHLHALALAGLERATVGAFRVYPIPPVPTAAKQN